MKLHQKIYLQLVNVLYGGEVGGAQISAGNLGALFVDDGKCGLGCCTSLEKLTDAELSVCYTVKSRDFPVAISHSTPDWQSLVIVLQRLSRFVPRVKGTSEMVER